MQDNAYTSKFFDKNFMKNFMPSSCGMLPFNLEHMVEIQRKNIQAMTDIHRTAMENIRMMSRYQVEMMSRIMQDHTVMARQIMAEGTPEEKVARQADMVCKAYERSIDDMNEFTDMMAKSSKETGEIISNRVTASLVEFKSSVEKSSRSKSKAAA